jgi:hypothetical protein
MRIFFMSDIHGSSVYLRLALEAFNSEKCDAIAILGDIMYHGPRNPLPEGYNPAEVASIINDYASKITAVRGNCDSEVDQMLIKYPMMDSSAVILADNRKFFLTHGHICSPEKLPALNPGDIFAYGHTHIPAAYETDGIYIFNPGSTTLPKSSHMPSYGIYAENSLSVKSLEGEVILTLPLK